MPKPILELPAGSAGTFLPAWPDGSPYQDPATTHRSHLAPPAEIAARLGLDLAVGLSELEAAERLRQVGPNELQDRRPPSVARLLIESAREPFVLLLAAAGALAMALGEVRDGTLILLALIPIVGADVLTQYRGEHALAALRDASAPVAAVRRGGRVNEVAAATLVPGDLVLLRTGDVVPADLRLVQVQALQLDRSLLTGESLPEPTSIQPDEAGTVIEQARSAALAGTSVVTGRGEGIVVATGANTVMGEIARVLSTHTAHRSPMGRELDRLVRILLVLALGLVAVVSVLGAAHGRTLAENTLAGISAAIAAIPEEPPVLLAVVLGLGAYRLLRRGVLVRRLSAEETLGAVDLIVTDKTGTLTENRLVVRAIRNTEGEITDAAERLQVLEEALSAEEDAWQAPEGTRVGSFTLALQGALAEAGGTWPRRDERFVAGVQAGAGQFVSRTVVAVEGKDVELALGAPEAVLALEPGPGSPELRRWSSQTEASTGGGDRTLMLARRQPEGRWTIVALIGFADPLRDGVPEAIRAASRAGIEVIVVTGDHPATALAVARAAGLGAARAPTGAEVSRWDEGRLGAELPSLRVIARALPGEKERLVRAAQAAGRTVAVTGDGVNDAPALHAADVAVAMGSGTQVAKAASDLVLGDNAFPTLVFALHEGRRLIANITSGLVFLLSTHFALLGFILAATVVGRDQPLIPLQILWLELFIDLSTSVAFEREPLQPDAMLRPPRPRGEPILRGRVLAGIAAAGTLSVLGALAMLLAADPLAGPAHATWLAFTALVAAQAVRAYANRSLRVPVWRLRRNGFLLAAAASVVIVQALLPYLPPLASAFRAVPISPFEWTLVLAVAVGPAALAQVVRAATGRAWIA